MRLEIPDVPPSLNVLLNLHWRNQRRLRDKWILLVRSRMPETFLKPIVRMKVTLTLHHSRFYDKGDNLNGSCKPVFDALKQWRLIYDDDERYLEPVVKQEKCPHKRRHTVVELEPAGGPHD